MDHNPFAPEHHQPRHEHQEYQHEQQPFQQQAPPPPPVPAFSQNFTPAPGSFMPPQPVAPIAPVVPVDIPQTQPAANPTSLVPQPVVHVLSPRGVEYVFMTITLFGGALGLIIALIS